MLHNEQIK